MADFVLGLFKIVGFLVVFGSILFLIVVTTRFVGTKAKVAMKGKLINVVESISLGFDKQIHLVKVADQYVLIASCGKTIQYLASINAEIQEDLDNSSHEIPAFDFKSFFEKYLISNLKGIKGKKEEIPVEINPQEKSNVEVFKKNLGKLRSITNRAGTNEKTNGDDTSDEN